VIEQYLGVNPSPPQKTAGEENDSDDAD